MRFEAQYSDADVQRWREVLGQHDSVLAALPALGVPVRTLAENLARRGEYAGQWLRTPKRKPTGTPAKQAPKRITRVAIIPDAHIPYHDALAWHTALTAVRAMQQDRLGVDALVILGDLADCYEISDFDKNPNRKHNFEGEIDCVRGEMARVSALELPRVILLEGNHEHRLPRYLTKRAPELFNFVSIPNLLGVRERGWEWVPYGESVAIGKIHYSHDWGACGKYAVQRQLEIGHSVVAGHTHRAGCAYGGGVAITSPTDQRRVSWSMGWLGDFEQLAFSYKKKWQARAEWTHGIGTATMDETGVGWVQFHPVIEGRVIVDGAVVSGRESEAA